MGDFRHRVDVCCKLDALEQSAAAHFRYDSLAEGEDNVAVLVGVLEDRVSLVAGKFPTRGGDDFVIAIEGFVAAEKIEAVCLLSLALCSGGGEGGAADPVGMGGAEAVTPC